MADERVKAVLLFDSVGYHDGGQTMYADKVDGEVELPKDEFDRLEAAGAVAKSGTKAAREAAEESEPESTP
jgi:hypothetical protein